VPCGGRHKAQLNFAGCLTYAVARLADEPLLFAGNDFTETDLDLA
jgi:ribonuclease VapC